MAVGDVSITMNNLASGTSLQVQVSTRSRIIAGIGAAAVYGDIGISEDGVNFYTFSAGGWLKIGGSNASSIGNTLLCLPAGYYLQITNSDTASHDAGILSIEY